MVQPANRRLVTEAALAPLEGRVEDIEPWIPSVVPNDGAHALIGTDATGRIIESLNIDAYGRVHDDVMRAWAKRMAGHLVSELGIRPLASIAAFGDSLTERYENNGGDSWTTSAGRVLGQPISNEGVSGQTTTEIAVRQGGITMNLTVAGNMIPAENSTGITAYTPSSVWRNTIPCDYPGTLAGVRGVLRQNVTAPNPVSFHFWRETPGAPAACPPGTPFIIDRSQTAGYTDIIWAGRNNVPTGSVSEAIRDIDAMIASMRYIEKRFLVFSVTNSTSEGRGTAGYNTVAAINAHLSSTYPDQYVDVRSWLVNDALAAMGITPTSGDVAAKNADTIPGSLMQDTLHITEAAEVALGKYIASVITQRGLLA